MTTYEETPKDMQMEKMKAQLSTLKKELMIDDAGRNMLAELLISIDFRVAENDLEVLQLFFKRVYSGIEALKKERIVLKQELEDVKKQMEIQSQVILDLRSEVELLKPNIKEN